MSSVVSVLMEILGNVDGSVKEEIVIVVDGDRVIIMDAIRSGDESAEHELLLDEIPLQAGGTDVDSGIHGHEPTRGSHGQRTAANAMHARGQQHAQIA